MERLVGQKLTDAIKGLKKCSRSEVAIATGYYKERNGEKMPDVPSFLTAIASANGIEFERKRSSSGPRKKSYKTTCHGTNILMVGKCYVEEAGIEVGDKVNIEVNPGQIVLTRFQRPPSPIPNSPGCVLEPETDDDDEGSYEHDSYEEEIDDEDED